MKNCIVFTGGGTGGHVFPGLAVIDELKTRWQGRILWIGSYSGMEKKIIKKTGLPFYKIPAGKMRRYISIRNILDIFNVLAGLVMSFFILLKERPLVIFSKGGYVSVPVAVAGYVLGIPVITHESDLDPGIATRLNGIFATHICVSYRETSRFFPSTLKHKIIYTGNPVRRDILKGDPGKGRKITGCPDSKKIVLILGGSLGALAINNAIGKILDTLIERCFIIHQMGQKNFRESDKKNYYPVPFFHGEFPHILAAADIVVSRAGANTLWECAATGTPSILIPLSRSGSRGDQIRNAQLFKSRGISLVVEEKPGFHEKLLETIINLLDNEIIREDMKEKSREFGGADSLKKITDLLLEYI